MSDTMDEAEDQSHMFGKNLPECVSTLSCFSVTLHPHVYHMISSPFSLLQKYLYFSFVFHSDVTVSDKVRLSKTVTAHFFSGLVYN